MKNYNELLALVEEQIAALPLNQQPPELYQPIAYILSLGGKRLRPVLTLMATQMFNGNLNNAIQAALAVEVFHNFSLVHDDIMDKADIRRGQPTVHKKWNETIAILSGDLMMIKATQLLCLSQTEKLPELLHVFNANAVKVCEGQQLDMNFENQPHVTVAEYLNMIELKTAVLLGCSLQLGAICAGANQNDAEQLYAFGKNIGLAFQIQDDILDSFGSGELVGKKIGGDIVANKKTILLIELLNSANQEDAKQLENTMYDAFLDDQTKIDYVIGLYNKYQVLQKAAQLKEQYLQLAFQNLEAVQVPLDKKNQIKQTAIELMERVS